MADKKADLAGPGISTYPEVEKILPDNYQSILNKKKTPKRRSMPSRTTSKRTSAAS